MTSLIKLPSMFILVALCCGCGSGGSSANLHPVTGEWPLDILPEMLAERDSVVGDWKVKGIGLVSPVIGKEAIIRLPVKPPSGQYTLELEVTRMAGQGPLTIGMMALGNEFCAVIGPGGAFGVETIDGVSRQDNGSLTTRQGGALHMNQSEKLAITIRRNDIVFTSNGEPVANWEGDFSSLGRSSFPDGTEGSFFLRSDRVAFRVSSIVLRGPLKLPPPDQLETMVPKARQRN